MAISSVLFGLKLKYGSNCIPFVEQFQAVCTTHKTLDLAHKGQFSFAGNLVTWTEAHGPWFLWGDCGDRRMGGEGGPYTKPHGQGCGFTNGLPGHVGNDTASVIQTSQGALLNGFLSLPCASKLDCKSKNCNGNRNTDGNVCCAHAFCDTHVRGERNRAQHRKESEITRKIYRARSAKANGKGTTAHNSVVAFDLCKCVHGSSWRVTEVM